MEWHRAANEAAAARLDFLKTWASRGAYQTRLVTYKHWEAVMTFQEQAKAAVGRAGDHMTVLANFATKKTFGHSDPLLLITSTRAYVLSPVRRREGAMMMMVVERI
jgi:hypothetical protein